MIKDFNCSEEIIVAHMSVFFFVCGETSQRHLTWIQLSCDLELNLAATTCMFMYYREQHLNLKQLKYVL